MRLALGLIALTLMIPCGLGLLASLEPGVGMGWRFGYGLAGVVCFALAMIAFRRPRRSGDSAAN